MMNEMVKFWIKGLLENEINETPYNWLWSHNRWKIKVNK